MILIILQKQLSTAKATSSPAIPRPDHIVVVMEENRSYENIIGSSSAPYINSIASAGATLTNSYANEHPSQPNYLDFFSGSNQGVTDDNCPYTFNNVTNLGSELFDANLSFASYSEQLPAVGALDCSYNYYTRLINVIPDFPNVPTSANLPFTSFPTDFSNLPTVSFVVPDTLDDMHGGNIVGSTIQQADGWLQQNIDAYAKWAVTHNSLLILHWDEDEDNGTGSNHIPTIFYGPMVNPGQYAVNSNTILKNASISAWDAGATSTDTLQSGNGSVQVTADTTNYGRIFGLNNNETSVSKSDVAYGLQLESNGLLYIYENSSWKATLSAYTVGDVLKVAVENGIVKYYQNNTLLYTSKTAPTYPLFADASIRDKGGKLVNAIFCTGSICQPVTWTNMVNISTFTNHFNLLRTIEDMYGLPYLGQSGNVSPIKEFWSVVSSPTPSPTPTPSPSTNPTDTPTPTPTPTATPSPTPSPTSTPTDTTPPNVIISSPTNGLTLPSKGIVKVAAVASDASGIKSIQILIDSLSVTTCTLATSCNYNWNVNKVSSGIHTITAKATDNSPNLNANSTSISVIK